MILFLYTLAAILYGLRIFTFVYGAARERRKFIPQSAAPLPFVSVIVPARNEESNIETCIQSIVLSNFPPNNFEIVVVDDRSTDGTAAVLRKLTQKHPLLRVITLDETRTTKNLRGKPGALQAGIENSRGDIILMTDADCTVVPDWIATMARQFDNPRVGLVPSFTLIKAKTFFEQMQAIEWIMNHTMASAGVGLNQPLGCFGNNLAVRRTAYESVGGYKNIRFSVTEDLALLQAIFTHGWEVRYVCSSSAVVTTLPCQTLGEYIRQHHRWLRGGVDLGWRAVIFVAFSASLWICILAAFLGGDFLLLPLIFAIRVIGDFAVISPSMAILKRKRQLGWGFSGCRIYNSPRTRHTAVITQKRSRVEGTSLSVICPL
ncbi:MAG: glycosyltransferase [Ignavibacteria bacterium]|nr:glycosyltransferase [Ignavibacteria bacterium]